MKVQDYDPVVDQVVAIAEKADGSAAMLKVTNDGKLQVETAATTVNISGDLIADVNTLEETVGAKADLAATADAGAFSLVAIFKRGLAHLTSILGRLPVLVSGKIPVDVSFPATQPVSGTVTATGTVTANAGTGPFPVSDNGSSLTVDGTVTANAGTGTFAVSAASVPLPTGLTLASTRLLVDGSGVTQPVSGTITANAGTGPFPVSDNGSSLTVDGSVSVSNFPATQPVSGTVTANAGTGTFAVSATALPLPTGAASESTLSTLNGKVPASLTVSASRLLVDGSGVTQPITGQSVAFSEVTGTAPAASTEVLGANAARRFLLIQNLSTAPFHISFGGIASTSTLRIDGGATLVFEGLVVPNQNIRMIQTQSNQGYYIAHN